MRECVLKEHLARDGALHDVYGYGLLRPEFEAVRDRLKRGTEGFTLATMVATLAQDASGASP